MGRAAGAGDVGFGAVTAGGGVAIGLAMGMVGAAAVAALSVV